MTQPSLIPLWIGRSEQSFAERICVCDLEDGPYTFARIGERSRRLANGLRRLGVREGDRVGVLFPNDRRYLETFLALMRSGFTRVPLNARETVADHVYKLSSTEVKGLIVHEDYLQPRLLEEVPGLDFVIVAGSGSTGAGVLSYESVLESSPPEAVEVTVEREALARVSFTGGTTGRPKGVMLPYRSEEQLLVNTLTDLTSGRPSDCMLHVTPLSHSSGPFILPHYLTGAAQVILRRFQAERFFQLVTQYEVTTTFLVPTMLFQLLDHPDADKHDLSSLQNVIYGAASMPVERIAQAIERFGPIFTQLYGQAEAPMLITRLASWEHELTDPNRKRLGSVGRACTLGGPVRVVDEEMRDAPEGEIVTRGPLVMRGYWRAPEETRRTVVDGWLRTGDLGYIDEHGYVYLTGRKKDMIISGGFNIYPREIEEVLYGHPAVSEAAVIGVSDPHWGEAVKACIVLKQGADLTEQGIVDYCAQALASYKKPKYVEFYSSLPKSAVGKILKEALKQQASHSDS